MTKGKKKTVTIEIPEAELDEFREVAADDLPADVDNILKEIGEDITRVICYRRLKGEKQAYVGTLDADEFSMDEVARRWGGGRYLARLVGPQGIFKGVTFYIDESIKPSTRERDGDGSGNAVTDKLLDRVLDKLGGGGSQRDPVEIAASLQQAAASQAQAMTAAITAAMAPLLAQITALASRGGNGTSPSDLLQLIEFGADRFGGKEDGMAGVVRDVGIPLVNLAQEALTRGQPTRRPAPVPAPTPVQLEATVASPPGTPPWVPAVRPYIAKLLAFAQRGDDPGLWAGVLDAQFPRLAHWLEDAVQDPQFETTLYHHFPELAPVAPWMHALLDEFLPEQPEPSSGSVVEPVEDDEE